MSSPARPRDRARTAASEHTAAQPGLDELLGDHATILESVAAGIYAVDADGATTYVNAAGARMFGWRVEDLLGRRSHDLIHHSRADGSPYPIEECPIYETLRGGVTRAGDEVFWRRDGSSLPVHFVSAPIRDGERVIGAVFTFTDATERNLAEQAFRESEERYRVAIENVQDYAIFMVDLDGRARSWNAGVERILGYGEEEFIGLDIARIFTPEDVEAGVPRRELATAAAEGRVPDERWHVRRDGTRFYATGAVSRIRRNGHVSGFVKVMRDRTDSRRTEDALRFLADASEVVAASVDYRTTLDNVARLAVPALADWCAVQVLDDEASDVEQVAVVHSDPAKTRLVRELQERYPPDPDAPRGYRNVMRTGKAELIPEITDSMLEARDEEHLRLIRTLGLVSVITVPMAVSGRTLGTITFASAESGRRYTEQDASLAVEIARRAATAVENARLYDRSERQRASLQESEERFRLLVESVRDYGIFMLDPEGLVTSWNTGAERITGYPADEMIGSHFSRLYTPEDLAAGRPQRELRIAAAAGRYEEEGWRVRRDGSRFWANVVVTPVRHASGDLMGFAKVTRDLTDRRRVEENLRESEERFRLLVDGVRDYGIFMLDPEGLVTSWNTGAERITGYPADEMIGSHFSRLYTPEDLAAGRPQRELRIAAAAGRHEEEGWRVRKGGARFWANVVVTALRNASGELIGFAKVTRDLTERRSLEEQLRQSQKMEAVGRLAGGIAHDFNNLLTAIMGYTDLLLGDLAPDDPGREELEEIRKAGERATNLTRQLLAFGRRQVLSPKVLDLNGLVDDMAPMLRRLIGEDIELAIAPGADGGRVLIDPGQLEQVILNLVVNARDAMPDGGKLIIETEDVELDEEFVAEHLGVRAGPYVLLAVTDTGTGMDEETRLRLFEPFFTTKPQGKGTGLGLATVYGVVTQSGGAIWVYSEPGQGTSFKIYLPRVEAEDVAPVRAPHAAPSIERGTETVLVVEDEPGVRSLIAGVLARHGYTVLDAPDPAAAATAARRHTGPIDLLVTDVVMPGSSGASFAERLRAERPGIKVLFISGYTDDAIVHHGVLEPDVAFLQKPFTPAAFAAKVREVLDDRPSSGSLPTRSSARS